MKRFMLGLGFGVGMMAVAAMGPTTAWAHDAYDDSQSNPVRLLAYGIHPIGYALEWLVTRPIHFAVSSPQLERVFGHGPHEDAFTSDPYRPDDYDN